MSGFFCQSSKHLSLLGLFLTSLSSSTVFSQEPPLTTEEPPQLLKERITKKRVKTYSDGLDLPPGETELPPPRMLYQFFGAGGGYHRGYAKDLGFDSALNGWLFSLKTTTTYLTSRATWNISLGWLYSKLSGDQNISGTQQKIHITTRSAFLEISPMYRLTPSWGLGPSLRFLFGSSHPFGPESSAHGFPLLVGLKTDFPMKYYQHYVHRPYVQLETDLFIPRRSVYALTVGYEIGLPLKTYSRSPKATEKTVVEIEKFYQKSSSPIIFDQRVVHFEFNKSDLTEKSRNFLLDLGSWLKENAASYSKIIVEGHTDTRGNPEYNLSLSEKRALAVASILIEAGVPSEKVENRGQGAQAPLVDEDTDYAHAMNRRVEFTFLDLPTSAKDFKKGIQEIQDKHFPQRKEGPQNNSAQ